MINTNYTLITGASQGFGKALSLQFAEKGFNLFLVALPKSGLPELSLFISDHYEVNVHWLELDLSKKNNCYKIATYIKDRDFQIKHLVNNAGVLSKGYFIDLDDSYILSQIKLNVITPTLLIRLLLPNLKASQPSSIINISSMASFFPLPKKQVYGGTKAYLLSFSKSLRKELIGTGVSVSVVCPGGLNTTTKLCVQNRNLGWLARQSILNPESAAKLTLKHVLTNKELIFLGRLNKMLMIINRCIPDFLQRRLIKTTL